MVSLRLEGRTRRHFRPVVEQLDERALPGGVLNQLGTGLDPALQDTLLLLAEASVVRHASASNLYGPVAAARRSAAVADTSTSTPSSSPSPVTAQAQLTAASPNLDAPAPPPVPLTSMFDLDSNGSLESSSTSTLTQGAMVGTVQTWNVKDSVNDGLPRWC